MTKQKTTKKSLLTSVLSLVLCVAMLVGTTFAWFTDSVTSANNKIQAGNLKIDLELLDEKSGVWNSLKESSAPIFDYDKWEPGYTDVKILKVENEGTLALKWVAKFISASQLSELANVIDVYVYPSEAEIPYPETTDRALSGYTRVGTVADFVNTIEQTTTGELLAGEKAYLGIALKMQESAGNEYQGMSLGSAFDIQIFATQLASESDSFDNQYDANAPEMYAVNGVKYATADEALQAAKAGDKVYLSSTSTPIVVDKAIELTIANSNIVAEDEVNAITVNADATIIVEGYNSVKGGKNGDGIYVANDVTLTLTGNGSIYTSGNAEKEYFRTNGKDATGSGNVTYGESISNTTDASFENTCGSGIYVAGKIVIDGLKGGVIAKGYGTLADQSNCGFGIGGPTESIVIKDSNIKYVRAAYSGTKMFIHDWAGHFYGKKEPTSGPAIGSSSDQAVIEITGSTVSKAEGGSKGAGIGARYHTGVTVNITDSTVTAVGGNASAGIGGSRVDQNATEADAIIVNIKNSTVTATGGDYAAGIGSGYNTHADKMTNCPVTTVNIDAKSNIVATGGWLGAGVGTGHNVINFAGDIKCNITNIKAGYNVDDCCHGALCSDAQDVGLGAYKVEALHTKISDGLYRDKNNNVKYYVYNANGFEQLNTMMADKSAGQYVIVKLSANINMTGKTWTPVDSHADTKFFISEFDGQGYTISNLTIKGQALFTRFAGFGDITVKDVTFQNAVVDSTKINSSILTVQTYQNTLLDNVDVKNSTITGGYKVAPLIATVYNEGSTTVTATLKNCDVTNCVVKATLYDFCTAGLVAFVNAGDNDKVEFKNCTVTDVTLIAPDDDYDAHAFVYTTGGGSLYNEAEGVTVTNCKFEVLN